MPMVKVMSVLYAMPIRVPHTITCLWIVGWEWWKLVMEMVETGDTDCLTKIKKYHIWRLRPTIEKFQKVLNIDLHRLKKHGQNIDRVSMAF